MAAPDPPWQPLVEASLYNYLSLILPWPSLVLDQQPGKGGPGSDVGGSIQRLQLVCPDVCVGQVSTFEQGQECRLGRNDNGERPFSGVTCCMDFCAHSHYDRHNMTDGGATVVSCLRGVVL